MKLPLELSNYIVDMAEVAVMKYSASDRQGTHVTQAQFEATILQHKRLIVALRSGHVLDLRGEDAAVFASVFGKKVKEWVNEQVLAWRKQFEENKDRQRAPDLDDFPTG